MRTLLLLIVVLFSFTALARADKYKSFAELSAHEQLNKDFGIIIQDRSSPFAVFAIHGGNIEPGTTELAFSLAGQNASYYAFIAFKTIDPWSLHLTSTRFDEPQALALAKKSRHCLSVHSYISRRNEKAVCVGGGDLDAAKKVAQHLKARVPELETIYPCELFPGKAPGNIVNRCEKQGVQLEISTLALDKLQKDSSLNASLVREIRKAFDLDEAPPKKL